MGKGSQQTTNSSSTSADPQATQAYRDLLNRAQGVAATPYQGYTGELTAPVNAQQNLGISGINAASSQAQPSINQALGLAAGASNPLTAAQIQQYQNPYTQNVVDATQAQFNNQNQQQQQQLTGNAISQGALGGNRVGVAQANLAGQQALAQAPTIANLYSQSYQQGLGAAERQFQQNPLAAAGSIANFGISGQNAALTGAGAQLGAGTVQQQNEQQRLQALYQQYQQQQAYPYQQTQWLAGLESGVGPGLGSSSTGQTTGPAPNQTSQYIGAGLAAASFLARGGRVGYADGGGVQHFDGGGVAKTPWGDAPTWIPQISLGNVAPHAGSAPGVSNTATPSFDYSKIISSNNKDDSPGLLSKYFGSNDLSAGSSIPGAFGATSVGGAPLNPMYARGGGVSGYADGGAPDDPFGDDNRSIAYDLLRKGQGIQSPDSIEGGEPAPSQGVAGVINPDEPYRMTDPAAVDDWRAGHPLPGSGVSPVAPNDDAEELPPEITGRPKGAPAGVDTSEDGQAMGYAPAGIGAATPSVTSPSATQPNGGGGIGLFNMSPNVRSGLLAAGLGMLASRSPNLGNAIGEGGLAGMSAYGAGQERDRKVADEAAKLSREAAQHAEEMKLKTDQQKETHRHNEATEEKEYASKLVPQTDPNTGETSYLTFNPKTAKLEPVKLPGADVVSEDKKKFVSTAAPLDERRKAPAASPEARDDSFYKYMQDHRPPGYADIVRAVADYEADPNRVASLQKGERARLYRDVKQYDPTYDQTHFGEKTGVIQNFSRGPASQAVNSLNVSVAHLGTLSALGDALQNGNIPIINKIGNTIAAQLGRPAPTNFEAAKEIVGDEVVKAVVGGVNSQADREAIKHLILSQQTPAQLKGVIQTFTTLLGGQLDGQRQRYQAGTGLNNFDQKYLSPATQEALTKAANGQVDPAVMKMVYPSGMPMQQGAAPSVNAVPPAADRVVGQTYQTPKGPAKWTAQGWVQ